MESTGRGREREKGGGVVGVAESWRVHCQRGNLQSGTGGILSGVQNVTHVEQEKKKH